MENNKNLIIQFKEMTIKDWIIGISIPLVCVGFAWFVTEILILLGIL